MPGPERLITRNLGSQTIGLAEFRVAPGGLVLVNYRLREVPLDPETGQRRDAHVAFEESAAVLREMMHEMQIPRRPVNYALPAQSVFARFVELPPVTGEKLDKIISFEAQQNVPFPLDEVVWDYQLVGGGLGEQIQVVLVAIKVDLLDHSSAVALGLPKLYAEARLRNGGTKQKRKPNMKIKTNKSSSAFTLIEL